MNNELHWTILDDARRAILPILKQITADRFYLAGGTGLALQLGHRDSIDFDFFLTGDFDTQSLIASLESVFVAHSLSFTQLERNIISCLIDESMQLSFMSYTYPPHQTINCK